MTKPSAVFVANVRLLRKTHGLSQAALAERLAEGGYEITETSITRLEKGVLRPTVDLLVAVASVLAVSPASLLAPYRCDSCDGTPPAGFQCSACLASTPATPKES